MGRNRVQLLVLLTFMVAATNCVDSTTTDTSTTANTISSDLVALAPPDPSVTEFNYYVRDPETGVACILANMSISIKANYTSTDYNIKEALLKIPSTAKVSGTCSGAVPTMELTWTVDPTLNGTQNIIMFRFGSTGNISFLQDIAYDLYLDNKTFPDARLEGSRYENTLKSVNIFAASKNHGLYKCALETTVRNINVAITITDVALIAFNTEQSVATKTEENCVPATDPATTPLPPPDPSVTEFNYYVRDAKTGVACILANMSISIEAKYISTGYNLKTATLKIPPTAEVRGTCRNTTPTMELIWAEDPTLIGTQNGIAFIFGSTGNISFLQDIVFELYMDNKTFPDASIEGGRYGHTLKSVNIFAASKNHGLHKCALETTVGSITVAITITNVALIAFNTEQSVATKTEENCVPATDPATTPLPPPDPSVTEFNYYVRDPETGVACILANMSISIEANYISMDYNTKTATLKIPPTAEVRGTCRGAVPTMELIWAEDPILEGALNGMALMFGSTDNTFFLQDIILELYIDNKTFPDAMQEGKRFGTKLERINKFSASKSGGLYRCELETRVGTEDFKITITDVTLIAFNTEESIATRTEEKCDAGTATGAIVGGVIGGVALIAIIIIVIVVWRKKCR